MLTLCSDAHIILSYHNLTRINNNFTKFNEKQRWDHDFERSQVVNIDEIWLLINIIKTMTIAKFCSKAEYKKTIGKKRST